MSNLDRQVYINVYDLIEQNDYTYWLGLGIFHSGVEIYGVEYAFGGHEYDVSGVFQTAPKQAPNAVFREQLPMGETTLTPQEVYNLVRQMGIEYKGKNYHLLQMNCNSFSSDLVLALTGKRPPAWINRIANLAISLHCLLPQGWIPPLRPPTAWPSDQCTPNNERTALLDNSPEQTTRFSVTSPHAPMSSGANNNGGAVLVPPPPGATVDWRPT